MAKLHAVLGYMNGDQHVHFPPTKPLVLGVQRDDQSDGNPVSERTEVLAGSFHYIEGTTSFQQLLAIRTC